MPPSDTATQEPQREQELREERPGLLRSLGPGLITGASDDDPSGIATYSQVGAQFGYGMLWTMLFSYPLMAGLQEISGRVGRVTGHGLAGNLRRHYPRPLLYAVSALLVVANVFNLGADIGAMGEAVRLLIGGNALLYATGFTVLSVLLQVFVPYHRYARLLKWLAGALLAYVATVFTVHVPWKEALRGAVWPSLNWSGTSLQALVAVLGTTLSPYLLFWQASEEVDELDTHPQESPLRDAPGQARVQFRRIHLDTLTGMAFSNLVAFCIILTAAVTLHAGGVTDIGTAAQAAGALRPLAGPLAFELFAAGIVGTGLLAMPVLAGSAGYALGEALDWPVGLERRLLEARGFYAVIAVATLLGLTLNFLHLDPLRTLFYAAVVNGVTAAPVMALLMLVATNRQVMGPFVLPPGLKVVGWLATLVMAAATVAMLLALK